MKIKSLVISVLSTFVLTQSVQAADGRYMSNIDLRNRVKVAYGDGLLLGMSTVLATLWVGVTDVNSPGGAWVSYRHISKSGRWSYGGDLGYIHLTSTSSSLGTVNFSLWTLMPTVECYYLKTGICRLYGAASLGVAMPSDSDLVIPAFHFSPLGIRLGNDRIAGFLEGGFGYKGFCTVGIEVGF